MTRVCDIVCSVLGIIVLLPLMVPVMIGLRLTGERHIFYRQSRVGRGNEEFGMIKFATMLQDSPNLFGGTITQRDDPRILPMGRFLRKTKINEVPQLFNVIMGQMSLVGPRPVTRDQYDDYTASVKDAIEKVRPGLTGMASLVFRDEERILDRMEGDRSYNHSKVIAPYKGELEVWFTRQRTLRTYLVLILLTAWSVVRPSSRIWTRAFADLPKPPQAVAKYL